MKFLIANWKMNGNLDFTDKLLNALTNLKINNESIKDNNHIIICPPFPLLYKFQNSSIDLGAQNCSNQIKGAFTGEVSPLLLKELGCKYVIIGHSERRQLFNESIELIFSKYKLLTELDIRPIICIGESLEEKDSWKDVLSIQLSNFKNDPNLSKAIIAYEPIWCIGSGKIPTKEEIHQTLSFIKQETNNQCPTIYGGSVNLSNIKDILKIPSVDGVLIGGASLKVEEFSQMVQYNN